MTSGVPPSVLGANATSAVALAVLPPVPVVGVADGLPVSVGVALGVAVAVLLGVGVGVADALAVGAGELLGEGVGVQATAGSALVPFFRAAPETPGRVFTPIGGCHSPGVARPAAAESCCWPGEVTELVGVMTVSWDRLSAMTPPTTTATTAPTASAGLSHAAAGPSRRPSYQRAFGHRGCRGRWAAA